MLRLDEFPKAGMSASAEERWVSGSGGNKLLTVLLLGNFRTFSCLEHSTDLLQTAPAFTQIVV